MGLARRALDLATERRSTNPAFGVEAARIPLPASGWSSYAGPVVTEETSLAHIDVWRCVSLIADAIAQLTMQSMRQVAWRDAQGQTRMYLQKVPTQPALLVDPIPDHLNSSYAFKHMAMTSLLTNGNTYNEIAAVDANGWPSVMTPIDPAKVRRVRSEHGMVVYDMIDGGTMGSFRNGGTMAHWPGFLKAGQLQGISPIAAGMQGIALGMAAERFGVRWFGDGANPSGILKHPDPNLKPEEAERIKKGWARTFASLNREPAIIYGGMEWQQLTISPEESQFILTRQMQGGQIASLYRIPPHLVGDVEKSTSWGTGIEEQGIGFLTFTLGPWVERFEQAMSFLLPRGQLARFRVAELMKGRQAERYASYAIGRQWGWLSVNDIREQEDLPPVPDGDVYLSPMNMVDAAHALDLLKTQMAGKSTPQNPPLPGAAP